MRDSRQPLAILFDLFGTLVHIHPERLPRERRGDKQVVQTIAGLDDLLAELPGDVSRRTFSKAAAHVSVEVERIKAGTHAEIPSGERFARILEHCGVARPEAERLGGQFAERHMAGLAGAVGCPPGRKELLEHLGQSYRIGLVSNFDHGPTARSILDASDLTSSLEVVSISDERAIRKPSPRIFLDACAELDVEPGRTLFVGDSYREDVQGAAAAGLIAVWVRGDQTSPAGAEATAVVDDVRELPARLEQGVFGS